MKVSLQVKNSVNYGDAPLTFNAILKTYNSDFDNISEFYENSPQDIAAHFSARVPGKEILSKLGDALLSYNKKLGGDQKTLENIKLLKKGQARVIVTGQQPTLLTGPLLVPYKALSAIRMAEHIKKSMMRPVVPVFWNASEDHNISELDHTFFMNIKGDLSKVKFPVDEKDKGQSAGKLSLGDSKWEVISSQLKESLIETEFTGEVMELLKSTYDDSSTYGEWFGRLILKLFKGTGLIILDPAIPALKKLMRPILQKAIEEPTRPSLLVNEVGNELSSRGYKRQILRKDDQCSFFIFNKSNVRESVSFSDGVFKTESAVYSKKEMLDLLEKEYTRFSPNVVLRPILSEYLLPTISYMAGPGELSYYAQLKKVYKFFDVPMPIIHSRLSMSLLENKVSKVLDKFSFSPTSFLGDTNSLLTNYVKNKNELASEYFWNDVKEKIEGPLNSMKGAIAANDPSSLVPVEAMVQKMLWQLGKIEEKVVRNQKNREKEAGSALEKVKKHLKPENTLQERQLNIFYYINKYGFGFWEALKKDAPTDYTQHHFMSIKTEG